MRANHLLLQLTLAIAAAGFAGITTAAMYKWTDADGNIQYSETPPDSGEVKEIAPPPRINPPSAPEAAKQADKEPAKEEGDNGEAPLSAEELETYRHNCEGAKANLDIYRTSSRIRQPNGEIVRLSDEQRQEKIQLAEEQVKKFCK